MRRAIVTASLAATLVIGVTPARADVHGFSQAGCAAPGAPSGAIASRDAVGDPGRPAAPIMVNASPFDAGTFPGQGGSAGASGTNC